jgi:hypothetical protein
MREIKFRGYNGMDWIYSRSIDIEYENDNYYMFNYENGEWEIVNRVGQYTCLKDLNGKEIYEGDILDTHAQFNDIYIRKVVYKDCGLVLEPGTGFTLTKGNERHFEVIGNIYENPELLDTHFEDVPKEGNQIETNQR